MSQRVAESTLMFEEASESGAAVSSLLADNRAVIRDLAHRLRTNPPAAAITCARGSSDNAATYARYLMEMHLGVVTGSMGLSVASIYHAPLQIPGGVAFAVSQSGASPDLLSAMSLAGSGGATCVALVNAPDAPVNALAHYLVRLSAGPEVSVAATKSFIASLAAIAWIVAEWAQDKALLTAVEALPDLLQQSWDLDWSAALPLLQQARGGFVLGRGPGLSIAQEAALKMKETCGIHAEALSAAEVEHGPMALVGHDFPVLVFAQRDAAHERTAQVAARLIDRQVPVLAAGLDMNGAINLPVLAAHPVIEPILKIQSFYRLAATLSVSKGLDPDQPPHLKKVTRTL